MLLGQRTASLRQGRYTRAVCLACGFGVVLLFASCLPSTSSDQDLGKGMARDEALFAIRDREFKTRQLGWDALVQSRDRAALGCAHVTLLSDTTPGVRTSSALYLSLVGDETLGSLLLFDLELSEFDRRTILYSLLRSNSEMTWIVTERMLSDPSQRIRDTARLKREHWGRTYPWRVR